MRVCIRECLPGDSSGACLARQPPTSPTPNLAQCARVDHMRYHPSHETCCDTQHSWESFTPGVAAFTRRETRRDVTIRRHGVDTEKRHDRLPPTYGARNEARAEKRTRAAAERRGQRL